jgi:hypothetical protein
MAALRVLLQSPKRSPASISVQCLTASDCARVILTALCVGIPTPDDQPRRHRDRHSLNLFGPLQLRDEWEAVRSFVVGLFHGLMVNGAEAFETSTLVTFEVDGQF